MKIGDVIVDKNDHKWLVFDISGAFIYCVDYSTQKYVQVLTNDYIQEVIEMPNNVKCLYLIKRLNNLKGLEKYL